MNMRKEMGEKDEGEEMGMKEGVDIEENEDMRFENRIKKMKKVRKCKGCRKEKKKNG